MIPPLLAAALAPGCGAEVDGLEKYPVRGSVTVNGEPAEMMVVTFHNVDPAAPGNAARPVAATDAEGKFALSTNGDKDGAVAGEYIATFFWSSENSINAFDRLDGRFTDPKTSKFRVRVERAETDLEPFRIELDPKRIRPKPDSSKPNFIK